jgi:hypothetical protein
MPTRPSLKNHLCNYLYENLPESSEVIHDKDCDCETHPRDLSIFIHRYPNSAAKACQAWKKGKRLCNQCKFLVHLGPEHLERCGKSSPPKKDDSTYNEDNPNHATLHGYFCRVQGPCKYHYQDQQYFRRN